MGKLPLCKLEDPCTCWQDGSVSKVLMAKPDLSWTLCEREGEREQGRRGGRGEVEGKGGKESTHALFHLLVNVILGYIEHFLKSVAGIYQT